MTKRMPIRDDISVKASGGTYDFIETKPVPPGEIWCIQNHSFENETGARGIARGYRGDQRSPHFRWEEPSLAAGELAWSEKEVFLIEGERLGVRQTSCTLNDVLRLTYDGYKIIGRYIDEGE